jgi:hypothetical protein
MSLDLCTENENKGFVRYLPIDIANAKIRSALLSLGNTKDVHVDGLGTTKLSTLFDFVTHNQRSRPRTA